MPSVPDANSTIESASVLGTPCHPYYQIVSENRLRTADITEDVPWFEPDTNPMPTLPSKHIVIDCPAYHRIVSALAVIGYPMSHATILADAIGTQCQFYYRISFGIRYPIPSVLSNCIRKSAKNSWYYWGCYLIWARYRPNANFTIKPYCHWLPGLPLNWIGIGCHQLPNVPWYNISWCHLYPMPILLSNGLRYRVPHAILTIESYREMSYKQPMLLRILPDLSPLPARCQPYYQNILSWATIG